MSPRQEIEQTMNKFNCEICGSDHPLTTLVQCPRPRVIGQITSGELDHSLDVIANSLLIVNREVTLLECELSIDLLDDEDQLDLHIWVSLNVPTVVNGIKKMNNTGFLDLQGEILEAVPFYEIVSPLQANIQINLEEDELPRITSIHNLEALQRDLEHGISITTLKKFLSSVYHSEQGPWYIH